MPRNYGPTVNPGDTRDRIWRATFDNPHQRDPSHDPVRTVTVHEEVAVRLQDGTERVIERPSALSALDSDLDNDQAVDLYHPVTHEVIGQTTMGACKAHVYTLLHQIQLDRDAAEAEAAQTGE